MESSNLIIRNTIFSDCIEFSRWERDKDVTRFFSMNEDRDYEEITREFILNEVDPSKLQFTIVDRNDEHPIGRVQISRIDCNNNSLDITRIYIGDTEYRGRGYGEEVLNLLLEFCFINLHMERVTIDHFTDNIVASNLYKKLGFEYEGIARHAAMKDGKYYDLHLMSILRGKYFEQKRDND